MQEFEVTKNVPAVIEADFKGFMASVRKELERYDVVVTLETLADAKKMATELNQSSQLVKRLGKDAYDQAIEPANQFKARVAEAVDEIQEARQKLVKQVKVFEDQRLELAREKLTEKLAAERLENGVEAEFHNGGVEPLVKLGALTQKDNLSASAINAIRSMVSAEKAAQDRRKIRLLELENQCFRAGLDAPLSYRHVSTIIDDPDEERYKTNLTELIEAELDRQKEIVAAQAKKADRKQELEQAAADAVPEKPDPVQEETESPPEDGTIDVVVTFTLRPGRRDVTDDQVKRQFDGMMQKAGITAAYSIKIVR